MEFSKSVSCYPTGDPTYVISFQLTTECSPGHEDFPEFGCFRYQNPIDADQNFVHVIYAIETLVEENLKAQIKILQGLCYIVVPYAPRRFFFQM